LVLRRKGKTVEVEISIQDCSWTENCMHFNLRMKFLFFIGLLSFFFFNKVYTVLQVNFLRNPQPEKESQSFSLIYQNGERSLDLVLFLFKYYLRKLNGLHSFFNLILVWIVDFIVPRISWA